MSFDKVKKLLIFQPTNMRKADFTILNGKVAFITGGSRGIGKAIALRLASLGVKVVIGAKTIVPNPKLPGTIYDTAAEIEAKGGIALPIALDIRFEDQIDQAVQRTVDTLGSFDILINNASAIHLAKAEHTPTKKFDLMQSINVRGTYLMSRAAIPHLKKSEHAHIINLSPPISFDSRWFASHTAYTISKYSMSMLAIGMAAELSEDKIGCNAIWPCTTIATAAVQNLLGGDEMIRQSRTPEIVADAVAIMLAQPPDEFTGCCVLDEDVLRSQGIEDFTKYAVDPSQSLMPDLFIS